jgi:hypothetical protein
MNWPTARAGNYLSHKQVMTAVFLLATGLGAYLVSAYMVSNDLVGPVMLALPFAFLVVVLPMLRNWRTACMFSFAGCCLKTPSASTWATTWRHILDAMRGDNQDTAALVSHQGRLRGRWGRLDGDWGHIEDQTGLPAGPGYAFAFQFRTASKCARVERFGGRVAGFCDSSVAHRRSPHKWPRIAG